MPTTVTSTIGTGGDYSTISAWWAAIPSNLVTADEIHIGQLLNQEHTDIPTFGGKTVDATRYIELTAAPGASWTDLPTSAMRYGFGARIGRTSDFSPAFRPDSGQVIRLSKIQLKNYGQGGGIDTINFDGAFALDRVLIESAVSGLASVAQLDGIASPRQCVFIQTGGSTSTATVFIRGPMYGCTIALINGATPALIGSEFETNQIVRNCAVFGNTATALFGGSSTYSASGCTTDFASPPSGFTTHAFSTTTGAKFLNITNGTHDLRLASDSSLIGQGVVDATNSQFDAYGTTRGNPPTSGAFDFGVVADTTPPTLTGSITIGTVTDVSIQMSWPAGSDNVAVVGYDVSSNGGSSYTSLGNVLTHTFTGLSPSTSYGLRVRARDAAGNLSTPVLSATQSTSAAPDTTPPTMTGVVTPSAVGVTTATITWTAGSDNVAVTGYEYRLNGGSYVSVGNVLTTNLTGLTASTLYNVDVRAFDAANNKSAVVSGSFTTSAVADTTPPTLTGSISIGTVTSSSIQFSWPAGSDNVAVVGYDVSLNGGTSYTSLGNVLTHTYTGLSASTIYSLRVRARDAAGNVSSALSSSQSTGSPSVTAKRIVVVLTSNGTTPAASLTNLKWAFFNEARPDLMNAPAAKGAIESTDSSGVLEIDVSSSTLAIGQTGWLIITDSDGTITQNPPAKAFSAPVQVIE